MDQEKAASETVRSRGRPWPAGVSGNPSGRPLVRIRARKLFATMIVDFGELGPTDRILLERAGFLLARSERLNDADVAMRMSAEARRIIASLRKRVSVPPAPAEPFGQVAAIAQAASPCGEAQPRSSWRPL